MADQRPQPIVVYLAHPVGAVDAAGVEQNLRHARRWLRWLIDLPNPATTRISWCVPWLAYVETLGDNALGYRERGLRDTLAVLERCDAVVALARATPGVSQELALAHYTGKPVADLIALGVLPPSTGFDGWWNAHPARDAIGQLVDLVAKVERLRELRGAPVPISVPLCTTCHGTGKELLDCDGSAGFRRCPRCDGGGR